MLNRRKNLSHKQRREQLLLKRAVKRGDISPPPALKPDRRVRKPRKPTLDLPAHAVAARRLQSAFIKLPAPFLKKTEILASALPLTRPIAPETAILSDVDIALPGTPVGEKSQPTLLTCPRRPKWRYDMSKNEIEANEEGLFRKWLAETDAAVNAWCTAEDVEPPPDAKAQAAGSAPEPLPTPEPEQMPHAPTTFERNIEVYRQLWRVTEISQILLILLDSRCPTLHFPPSLETYLASASNAARLRPILVLTKVDIAGPERAAAWTLHLQARFPGVRVVQVESYVEKHPDAHGSMSAASRRAFKPYLPSAFRGALVDALKATHAELLVPPEDVRASPEKLKKWRPRVKAQVDWEAVVQAHGGKVGTAVTGVAVPKADKHEGPPDGEHTEEDSEPEVLTIGVIGQPNVGKSSLLNALFGAPKVRASRTPGKTKHFQTLFWTPEVRLVDCPGLIFPNYVPMEMQVLSGILPISRVSAIPLCIHHSAQLLPLERVLGLAHPALAEAPTEDKRTWRAGMRPSHSEATATGDVPRAPPAWTTADILTAYAEKKGWITARVGRPDIKRAGNAILRALAEGRIRWAFWPPGTDPGTIKAHQPDGVEGAGIWLAQGHAVDVGIDIDIDMDVEDHEHGHGHGHDEEHPRGTDGEGFSSEERSDDGEDEEEDSDADAIDEGSEEEEEDDDDDGEAEGGAAAAAAVSQSVSPRGRSGTGGRFGALVLDDDAEDAEDEDGEGKGDQDVEASHGDGDGPAAGKA